MFKYFQQGTNLFKFKFQCNLVFKQKLHFNSSQAQKVLCSDPIDQICRKTFEKYGWQVTELPKSIPEEELIKIIGEYNALVVRSGTKVTENVIQHGKNLKYIGRAGTGVDNIDLEAATNKGILVMNTPGGNTVSTAEHTMALIMSLSRNIPQGTSSLQEGRWDRKFLEGVELSGKTIGIIGIGKIGALISKWCNAFGMRVIGYDPVLSPEKAEDYGLNLVTLDKIYEQSDFITVHTPLNNNTKNLFNKNSLQKCKKGVKLINCARGGIINEEDLLEALEKNQVGGAALDVFSEEPPKSPILKRLISHKKVVSTPHLGASTGEAQVKVAQSIAQQISEAFLGQSLFGVVNAPVGYELAMNPGFQPYIALGQKIGSFQGQMMEQSFSVKKIEIQYFGEFLQRSAQVVTSAVLAGLLNSFQGDVKYNLMNSQVQAANLGLQIQQNFNPEHSITKNVIGVIFEGEVNGVKLQKKLLGSCYGANKDSYLIGIDDYEVFLPLDGHILVEKHQDTPGVLADTTRIMAQNNYNIQNLYLGRNKIDGTAISGVQVDRPISEEIRGLIQNTNHVNQAYKIHINKVTFKFSSKQKIEKPNQKPQNPNFSSGPCSKHPEFDLKNFALKDSMKVLGRSHRSKLGKQRIALALEKTRKILNIPENYKIALVPGSDTGAVEMAMWSMLGPKTVDVAYWESFGKGWYTDVKDHLKLKCNKISTDNYGELPDLSQVNPKNDLVFVYNGTTSGVKVKNLDFISENREGLVIADCTSGIFAQNIGPYSKIDVLTFSWQKVLGGEGGHGILILSPKAVERLESYKPERPLPKIFRMTKKGKLDESLFKDSPINTPSMLCIEDYIDALEWVERQGGVKKIQEICDQNLKIVEDFVKQNKNWISFLAKDPEIRSNTSVCLAIDASSEQIKKINSLLENEGVAYDVNGYKDAPPSLRIWCGATVKGEDIRRALEWIKWAFQEVKQN
ncbi:Pyridoxal phosphate-dependent transferase [Pseudocohnilembus persalinus]|uniref:D-3-phosphoglycerate dehydrogenase n=1 Tax=Pseudocohnilembus persalinus TaxID=266149 RepID=A0A0V0R883_PSEPJ|nr:Pyridoxal phosphate-dependent transferase [Pseudocohnilembus persalinus]|eukprot:KRX10408.1 Pyridoxal phosphate-dependent transferase [Pseudocohnilembus persalinus]